MAIKVQEDQLQNVSKDSSLPNNETENNLLKAEDTNEEIQADAESTDKFVIKDDSQADAENTDKYVIKDDSQADAENTDKFVIKDDNEADAENTDKYVIKDDNEADAENTDKYVIKDDNKADAENTDKFVIKDEETEPTKNHHHKGHVAEPVIIHDNPPMADWVNDDMSYKEAFDTARSQVGPGGCFTYQGKLYTTYSSNELNNLSHEQISALNNSLKELLAETPDIIEVDARIAQLQQGQHIHENHFGHHILHQVQQAINNTANEALTENKHTQHSDSVPDNTETSSNDNADATAGSIDNYNIADINNNFDSVG